MKKKCLLVTTFILLGMLLGHNHLWGQSLDTQWYVKDGMGWDGGSHAVSIQNRLTISGIDLDSRGRNDFFIIFNNGSHFNSRYDRSSLLIGSGNLISFEADEIMKYVYFTNVYDVEPPPERINVSSGLGHSSPLQFNSISPTETDYGIYANHNVVYGKDITLIARLTEVKPSDEVKVNFSNLLIKKPNDTVIPLTFTSTVFDLQPVFKGSNGGEIAVLSSNLVNIRQDQNEIILNYSATKADHIYINLRPSNMPTPLDLLEYEEIEFDPISDSLFVRFTLSHNQETYELIEPVLYAFDPNYIHALSICNECSKKRVFFKGNFYNATKISANSLAFSFELPEPSSLNTTLTFTGIKVNGQEFNSEECEIMVDENTQSITVLFPDTVKIPDHSISSERNGHVDFSFYLEVNEANRSTDIQALNLNLLNPKTYFSYGTDSPTEFDLEYTDATWRQLTGKADSLVYDSIRVLVNSCYGLDIQCPGFDFTKVFTEYWWALILGLAVLIFISFRGKRFW